MIVVVPCGAKKRSGRWPAKHLYLPTGFRRQYMQTALEFTTPDKIFILSAKYGLLGLEDVVDSYDITLASPDSIMVDVVREQARRRGILAEVPLLLLRGRYLAFAAAVWPVHRAPLAGHALILHELKTLRDGRRAP